MCCMRFTMSSSDRKEVEHQLKTAQHLGNLRQVKDLLAILAVMMCNLHEQCVTFSRLCGEVTRL